MFRHFKIGLFLICFACLGAAGCGEPVAKLEPIEFTNPMLEPDLTFAEMDAVAQLTDEEKIRVEAAFQARGRAFAAWENSVQGQQVKETLPKIAEADASGDKSLRRSYEVRLRPALEAQRTLLAEHQELILAAMSEESVERWQAHVVLAKMNRLTESLQLASDQQINLEDSALEAVAAFPPGTERLTGAFFRLEKKLESEVLTAQQLEEYKRIKRANPQRGVTW